MDEVWKPIKGYEGLYEVSNKGRVKSFSRKEPFILKYNVTEDGYYRVCLYKNTKYKKHLVHRLVAQAFIENPMNLEMINHKDEDKTNNCVENLEWCTHSYNQKYSLNLHPERKREYAMHFIDKKTGLHTSPMNKKGARKRIEPIVLLDDKGNIKERYKDSVTARDKTGIKDGLIYYVCGLNSANREPKRKNHVSRAKGLIFCFDNKADIENTVRKL